MWPRVLHRSTSSLTSYHVSLLLLHTPTSRPLLLPSSPLYIPSANRRNMGSIAADSTPRVRVFIAGGSYAGLSTALNLMDLGRGESTRMAREPYPHNDSMARLNVDVTMVDERDGFLHLIGSPLALAETEYSKKAWVKYRDIPALDPSQQTPGSTIRILQGSVTGVDCAAKTASVVDSVTGLATTYEYDYFVATTGLRRVWPVVPQALNRKQYLIEAGEHIHAVSNARDGVVVVGGGAVGIEMAAELKLVKPHVRVTLVHSRDKLLSSEGLPDECKDRTLKHLLDADVDVLLNHRLASSKKLETGDGAPRYEVTFTNGKIIVASEVIMAMSKSEPTTSYLPSEAVNAEGFVKILPNLSFPPEVPNAKYHFCGGDATQWSGIKRCGGAMHHGNYIAQNIHQSIMRDVIRHEPTFQELQEVPPMIGLAVGKNGVAYGPEVGTLSGEDIMKAYFGDDLGFTICWNYLQLGGKKEAEVTA